MNFHEFYKKRQIRQVADLLTKVLALPQKVIKEGRKAHDITEKFWLDPNSPLFHFLNRNGIKIKPGIVPPFAQGGVGRVYFVDKYAIKFTANRVEANVAKMVMGRTDLGTVIQDVEYLDNYIYVILQPYVNMKDVPEEIKQAASYLQAVVDDNSEMNGFPTDLNTQKQLCRKALLDNGGDLSLLPQMLVIINILSRLYQATGFQHNDAGPSNVGLHGDQVVIPDLGPNEDKYFDTLAVLRKLTKNRQELGLPKIDKI